MNVYANLQPLVLKGGGYCAVLETKLNLRIFNINIINEVTQTQKYKCFYK